MRFGAPGRDVAQLVADDPIGGFVAAFFAADECFDLADCPATEPAAKSPSRLRRRLAAVPAFLGTIFGYAMCVGSIVDESKVIGPLDWLVVPVFTAILGTAFLITSMHEWLDVDDARRAGLRRRFNALAAAAFATVLAECLSLVLVW